ncbi:MAG: hypothetical protein JSV44_03270 [Candidatus Zixiibacteriota bacterium]|nr:MAG: hypothetical protein JSV44_03270 [candidate division Zixibacteria bacterium]
MKVSVQRYQATNRLKKSLKRQLVSSRFLVPALIVFTLIMLPCIHIWQRVYVMELVGEVTAAENENSRLTDILKKTEAKMVDLSRLSRIEQVATESLGLTRINSENIFTLSTGREWVQPDGLSEVLESLRKFADNLPVVTESGAETGGIFDEK